MFGGVAEYYLNTGVIQKYIPHLCINQACFTVCLTEGETPQVYIVLAFVIAIDLFKSPVGWVGRGES